MSDSAFEEGTYTITLSGFSRMVIETNNKRAVIGRFIGSKLQQWEISRVVGQSYSIRNLGTQMYLGMRAGERVRDGYEIVEVQHPFPWDIRTKSYVQASRLACFYVPYTNHVIGINRKEEPKLGAAVLIHDVKKGSHQQWWLSKDLHLATPKVLQEGAVYRIERVESQTAITLWDGRAVGFRVDDNSDLHKFIAIETELGWAFQNIATKRYLGLPTSIGPIPDGTQVTSSERAFTWIVLPAIAYTSQFQLWVPFTSYVMEQLDAEPNCSAPVLMRKGGGSDDQWWKFEAVAADDAGPTDSSQCVPGAPESKT
ncbi:hypothetical protein BKA70DRAFT_1307527 [Coprinopsis sp. MPI-PUGE-AT-0042]|nr:hypothetical protein BKA70DRAFT_1307527 [Coprinopsis sp. MPI-PUGE-AT-0042]